MAERRLARVGFSWRLIGGYWNFLFVLQVDFCGLCADSPQKSTRELGAASPIVL